MLDPVLAVLWRSQGNLAQDSASACLMWHSIPCKGEVASFRSKNQFCMDVATVRSSGALLHNFVYTCWRQKTSCVAFVPTTIVFSMKWHPSKLMGCNHHHKYTVTRPTARSWVFNSQSMGCKEWQAWGTQFPISLTALSENWKRIQKLCLFFFFLNLRITPVRSTSLGTAEEKHSSEVDETHSQYSWHCVSATHHHCHPVK